MRRFRFPIAVALTSLALVLVLGGVGFLAIRSAFAYGPWPGGYGPWGGAAGFQLPPELQGLHDLPPDQRFAHFKGAQLSLTDKDNRPLTLSVTPGTVTAASATSLTIAANDGTSKTYTLDDKTFIRGRLAQGGAQAPRPTLANDDKVVVMTINNSTTATAVMIAPPGGFGPHGPRGPFGPGR